MCKHYLHLAKSVILGHSETKCAVQSTSGCYYYLFRYCIIFDENPFLGQFCSHCTVTKLNDSSRINELRTQVTACFNNKCIQNFCLSWLARKWGFFASVKGLAGVILHLDASITNSSPWHWPQTVQQNNNKKRTWLLHLKLLRRAGKHQPAMLSAAGDGFSSSKPWAASISPLFSSAQPWWE